MLDQVTDILWEMLIFEIVVTASPSDANMRGILRRTMWTEFRAPGRTLKWLTFGGEEEKKALEKGG